MTKLLGEDGLIKLGHPLKAFRNRRRAVALWWEQKDGIAIGAHANDAGFIPAHQLRAYLKRLDAGKGKRGK